MLYTAYCILFLPLNRYPVKIRHSKHRPYVYMDLTITDGPYFYYIFLEWTSTHWWFVGGGLSSSTETSLDYSFFCILFCIMVSSKKYSAYFFQAFLKLLVHIFLLLPCPPTAKSDISLQDFQSAILSCSCWVWKDNWKGK